ncbi:Rhs-family protein [Psychrobacter sp. JCM 18903]|uniref:hypothetical protein n=1 Tax=Psychrobacter sp. JCM 18903 TaxID=1298610 RepID=UPI000431DF2E|nr:hypothetical protein [Psychrobacter sp. JCM 18903]GAF63026.1 Rhs-family protein [Psychrobacter sp. JCM 18903]
MRYDYNEIGQLISANNPNSRTNLAYDAGGRLITETLISHLTQDGQYQAREHTLTHDYDELGNRLNTTLPDGKVINQLYYGSGHLYNQSFMILAAMSILRYVIASATSSIKRSAVNKACLRAAITMILWDA